jgi:hypothetical protein
MSDPTVFNLSSTCLQPVFNLSSTCLQPVFNLSSTCLQPVFNLSSTCLQPVFNPVRSGNSGRKRVNQKPPAPHAPHLLQVIAMTYASNYCVGHVNVYDVMTELSHELCHSFDTVLGLFGGPLSRTLSPTRKCPVKCKYVLRTHALLRVDALLLHLLPHLPVGCTASRV